MKEPVNLYEPTPEEFDRLSRALCDSSNHINLLLPPPAHRPCDYHKERARNTIALMTKRSVSEELSNKDRATWAVAQELAMRDGLPWEGTRLTDRQIYTRWGRRIVYLVFGYMLADLEPQAPLLGTQVDALATVLMEEFGAHFTTSEGAVEMAIRVLREQRAEIERCNPSAWRERRKQLNEARIPAP